MKISVRVSLALIQALLLAALGVVGGAAWFAIDNANYFARDLALVNHAQRNHQQAQSMQDALRADVNAALLVPQDDPDSAEVVLASSRENALRLNAALDSLRSLKLPPALALRVTETRPAADAYVARATAITAIAVRNHDRGIALKSKFTEVYEALRVLNDSSTAFFELQTQQAEQQAASAAAASKLWIIAAALITAVVTCVFVALIARTMRSSLRRLRDVARALAEGNLAIRGAHSSDDEIGELSGAINKMADNLQTMIDRLRADAERDAFGTQLIEALELSDTESAINGVVGLAMSKIAPDLSMELLLSDSSRTHLERAVAHPKAGAPGCGVDSPFNCVAVRRGNAVTFEDSEALNACPHLRGRPAGQIAALCVPVSFMGRSLGVLHTATAVTRTPSAEQVMQLTTLGTQAGSRIGTVRAFERTQLQASTDSLTGLSNRRALEEVARGLIGSGAAYTFVLGDLDHFKKLNDGHGHEAGDKALRLFSAVMKKAVRTGDFAARWGGEEFAILLPRCNAQQGLELVQRLRESLAEAIVMAGGPPFTASFGIADSTMDSQFEAVIRISDAALYAAKDSGRDRATIGKPGQTRIVPVQDIKQLAAVDLQMLVNNA